jgi:hypothetical protein
VFEQKLLFALAWNWKLRGLRHQRWGTACVGHLRR